MLILLSVESILLSIYALNILYSISYRVVCGISSVKLVTFILENLVTYIQIVYRGLMNKDKLDIQKTRIYSVWG
jgi:hypothetical protein